jgi:hypothetical protein
MTDEQKAIARVVFLCIASAAIIVVWVAILLSMVPT